MKNIMAALREKLSAGSLKILSAPYLPNGLIWSALLIAYTDSMVILLGQPAGYWIDRSRAASQLPFLKNLLSAGLPAYLFITLVYLALLWLLLSLFTRSVSLVLWLPVSFIHLSHILFWLAETAHLVNGNASVAVLNLAVGCLSALILGILLATILLPRPSGSARPGRVKGWMKRASLGVWVIGLLAAVSLSAVAPRGGWAEMHPKHSPGRRAFSAVASDPVRQRLVLFGGNSEWIGSSFYYEHDTWEWDGNDWIQMNPKTSPSARAGHMMAYDEKNGVVVLFGGEEKSGNYMYDDTWIWDGKDWTQIWPSISPRGRRGGQLFYDPETERVILTGGFYYEPGKVFTAVNDAWAWDGREWEYLNEPDENLMITNPNVTFGSSLKHPVLFDYKRLLSWTNNQWKLTDTTAMPPSRFGTWLAGDTQTGRMMIFGGVDNNVKRNDTWLFDGAWKELHPALTPSSRDGHIMFYDPARKSFVVFGGISTYTLDDMWEYVLP